MSTLREAAIGAMGALETARNGLAWYRDRYPESTDGSDDEAAGDIDAAIDALRAELAKPDARPAPAEPQPAAQQEQAIEHCLWARNGHTRCPQQERKLLTEAQTKDLKHLRNYVANSDDGEICRGWLAALDVVLGITATKGDRHD